MPQKKIVGVAEMNIPGPIASTLAAQLKTMSDGKRPYVRADRAGETRLARLDRDIVPVSAEPPEGDRNSNA